MKIRFLVLAIGEPESEEKWQIGCADNWRWARARPSIAEFSNQNILNIGPADEAITTVLLAGEPLTNSKQILMGSQEFGADAAIHAVSLVSRLVQILETILEFPIFLGLNPCSINSRVHL